MKANMNWITDAKFINLNDDYNTNLVLRSDRIDRYLNDSLNIHGIVATKGVGKTYLVKIKSILDRNTKKGVIFIPKGTLLDKFASMDYPDVSSKNLDYFIDLLNHMRLWKLSIFISVIMHQEELKMAIKEHYEKQPLIKQLFEEYFIDEPLPSKVYAKLLGEYSHLQKLQKESIDIDLASFLQKYCKQKVYLYIDDIDEFYGEEGKENKEEFRYSEKLWIASQIALLKVAYQIEDNLPIHITFSMRKRAYDAMKKKELLTAQYNGALLSLSYHYRELKDIFIKNIQQEDLNNLIYPELKNTNPIKAFLGTDTFNNSLVNNTEEDAFNYIFRHSLGRPREFMIIGDKISQMSLERRKDLSALKTLINSESREIGETYLKELKPFFPTLEFEKLFEVLDKNVYTHDEIKSICCDFNKEKDAMKACDSCENMHIFCNLYSQGLVGYAKQYRHYGKKHEVVYKQEFMEAGKQPVYDANHNLPSSKLYFLHPCFSEVIEEYRDNKHLPMFHSNKNMVVGQREDVIFPNNTFIEEYSEKIHMHFGAGKLGLGLAVNLFSENKVIIVQRPSIPPESKTDILYHGKKIVLKAESSNEVFLEAIVVKREISKNDIESENNLLWITDNQNDIRDVASKVNSFSSSIGVDGIVALSELFKNVVLLKPTNFYPFENDDKTVEEFFSKSNNKHLIWVKVMADRICTQINFDLTKITVKVESYKEVVIEKKNEHIYKEINTNAKYLIVTSSKMFDYYKQRKFMLVNGLHMVLAILVYNEIIKKKININKARSVFIGTIINDDMKNVLKDLGTIQILTLISKYNDLIKSEGHSEVIEYSHLQDYLDMIIKRFSNPDDTLDRVYNLSNNSTDNRAKKIKDRFLVNLESISNGRGNIQAQSYVDDKQLNRITKTVLKVMGIITDFTHDELKEKGKQLDIQSERIEEYSACVKEQNAELEKLRDQIKLLKEENQKFKSLNDSDMAQ